MSESEFQSSMSLPLDSEGFLRRQCPTCEREFKVFAGDEAQDDSADDSSAEEAETYFCPYCDIDASESSWFTKAQLDLAQNIITREFVAPQLEKFKQNIQGTTGGLIETTVEVSGPPAALDPLTESDDMRRADFACHPDRPIKVADDYSEPVHCFVCGAPG